MHSGFKQIVSISILIILTTSVAIQVVKDFNTPMGNISTQIIPKFDLAGGYVYWWLGHTVSGSESYENGTIQCGGAITIPYGTTLTLKHINLQMFGNTSNGQSSISVLKGGSLYVLDSDNNPKTHSDSSNITRNGSYNYKFQVLAGSNFTLANSEVHYAGYLSGNPQPQESGIYIESSNVTITHSILSYNYNAIKMLGAIFKIDNCTIKYNTYGIVAVQGSDPKIINNNITNSYWDGISIQSSSSVPLIKNNNISYNGLGISGSYSFLTISNNTISHNSWGGMSLSSCHATINNNNVSGNGGGPTTIFSDDYESGLNGWTVDTSGSPGASKVTWNYVTDGIYYGMSHSSTHSWWYGNNNYGSPGNYDSSSLNYGKLISPVIDLRNAKRAYLSFWYWYETQSSTDNSKDLRLILIKEGSSTSWVQVNQLLNDPMRVWQQKTLDISSYIGYTVQIAFYFDTVDASPENYRGWYIDDFVINSGTSSDQSEYQNDGIYLKDSNAIAMNNQVENNSNAGVFLEMSTAVSLTNNKITDNPQGGIEAVNSSAFTAAGNKIFYNKYGIFTSHSSFQINNNTIINNDNSGIRAEYYSSGTATGNTIENNQDGIAINSSLSCTLINNIINQNNGNGISVTNHSKATLYNNILTDNLNYAIYSTKDSVVNWYIDHDNYHQNPTVNRDIILFGNLTVQNHGLLDLTPITLNMGSLGNARTAITVDNTSTLNLWKTHITAMGPSYYAYKFELYGTSEINSATIDYPYELYIKSNNVRLTGITSIMHGALSCIHVDNSTPTFDNSIIGNCTSSSAVVVDNNAKPVFNYCTIQNALYGIEIKSGAQPVVNNCNIIGNSVGVYQYSGKEFTITDSRMSDTNYEFYVWSNSHAIALNTTLARTNSVQDASDLTVEWYLTIKVLNASNSPIYNVSVWANNSLSLNEIFGHSDLNGTVSGIVTQYIQKSSGITYLTPHTITIEKGKIKRQTVKSISTSQTVTIYLTRYPYILSSPVLTAQMDTRYSYQVVAYNPDNDSLNYSLTEKPTKPTSDYNMTIDSTGMILWWPTQRDAIDNPHNVTVVVTDLLWGGTAVQKYKINVQVINMAPYFYNVSPPTSVLEGKRYLYKFNASDPNLPYDSLTFSLTTIPPSSMSKYFNPLDGTIDWTPTIDDVGNHTVLVKVTDSTNLSATYLYYLNVIHVPHKPVISFIPTQTAVRDRMFVLQVNVSDPDSRFGDMLFFSLVIKPAPSNNMTINSDGLIEWLPTIFDVPHKYMVKVIVTDLENFTVNTTFQILVSNINEPPTITSVLKDKNATMGRWFYYNVTADDPAVYIGLDTVAFSLIYAPENMTINQTGVLSAKISWLPMKVGNFTATVKVTNSEELNDWQVFNVTVRYGIVPPQFKSVSLYPTSADRNTTIYANSTGWFDIDGAPEGYSYQWQYWDNSGWVHIQNATQRSIIPGMFGIGKGESIRVMVTPYKYDNAGDVVAGDYRISNSITLNHAKPLVLRVSISPQPAYSYTNLTVNETGLTYDPDGDVITLTYAWYKNNNIIPGEINPVLPHDFFQRGDMITCIVTPYDSYEYGNPVSSRPLYIQNALPRITGILFSPQIPTRLEGITAMPYGFYDADSQNKQVYSYQWQKWHSMNSTSGTWSDIPGANNATLQPTLFARADLLRVVVTPSNGLSTGITFTSANITVSNAPPQIMIVRQPYSTDTDTWVTFSIMYTDADNDPPARLSSGEDLVSVVINGAEYTMTKVSGSNYSTGVEYQLSWISSAGSYSYSYKVVDSYGAVTDSHMTYTLTITQGYGWLIWLILFLIILLIILLYIRAYRNAKIDLAIQNHRRNRFKYNRTRKRMARKRAMARKYDNLLIQNQQGFSQIPQQLRPIPQNQYAQRTKQGQKPKSKIKTTRHITEEEKVAQARGIRYPPAPPLGYYQAQPPQQYQATSYQQAPMVTPQIKPIQPPPPQEIPVNAPEPQKIKDTSQEPPFPPPPPPIEQPPVIEPEIPAIKPAEPGINEKTCPNCGSSVSATAEECDSCGMRFVPKTDPEIPPIVSPLSTTEKIHPTTIPEPRSATSLDMCDICNSVIKPGISVVDCSKCKKIYHERCAKKSKRCISCGTVINA